MGLKVDRMGQEIFTAQKAKEGRVSLKKLNFWKI